MQRVDLSDDPTCNSMQQHALLKQPNNVLAFVAAPLSLAWHWAATGFSKAQAEHSAGSVRMRRGPLQWAVTAAL